MATPIIRGQVNNLGIIIWKTNAKAWVSTLPKPATPCCPAYVPSWVTITDHPRRMIRDLDHLLFQKYIGIPHYIKEDETESKRDETKKQTNKNETNDTSVDPCRTIGYWGRKTGQFLGIIFVWHCFCITYTRERRLPIIAATTKREQWNWPMARQWPKQKWAKSRTKTTVVSFLRLPTTKSRHRKHWEYLNSPWYFFLWFASIYVWWWNETTVSCVDLPTHNNLTTRTSK